MCWERRIVEGAQWAWDRWWELPAATRERVGEVILNWIAEQVIPFYADREEILRRSRLYRRYPHRVMTDLVERILPGSRYGELAQMLSPGSEPDFGLGEEIRRPVILVPGMVGTRLFRTGPPATSSSSLPPDRIAEWFERQLRSDDSELLRRLPAELREALRPVLTRLSDRHLYDPNAVWDPDTPVSLVHLMNKTASERGALFCPDVTDCAPATEFSLAAADSMTLRGAFSLLFGRDAERKAREAMAILGVDTLDNFFEDARYEALLTRRRRRGWCQPVWAVSEHWLLPLERTFNEVIYAFGYDWRKPLAHAAESLARKIERVKERHEGKSPILVTHSFGGLVARAAAKLHPENVGGIVQIFSPTAGSVKPYVNFKKGGGGTVPPGWQEERSPLETELSAWGNGGTVPSLFHFDPMDLGFMWILGWDASAFAATSSGAYGLYSLLPNNLPRYQSRGHWLNIEDDHALAGALRNSRNVYDLYRQFDRPWGLLDGSTWRTGRGTTVGEGSAQAWEWLRVNAGEAGSWVSMLHELQSAGYLRVFMTETLSEAQVRTVRERVTFGIAQAEMLDQYVGDWVHPNTWSVSGTGIHTDVGFNIRGTGDPAAPYATHRIVTTDGDGSLEIASARALSARYRAELQLRDVSHAHAMKESDEARAGMIKSVYLAMVAAHRAESGARGP
jgi:pimeloyl-ACP methyl ester carboxylesterase